MCGRYALGVPVATMRRQLQRVGHEVDEAPEDDEIRHTYNFAPGSIGLVYRATHRAQAGQQEDTEKEGEGQEGESGGSDAGRGGKEEGQQAGQTGSKGVQYKLQAMKWGLIPFWTKQQPSYGSLMKTINARDDSLQHDRGMWTSMKKRKRCIVVCTGYYEWRKAKGRKIPHYFKRKDGNVMCLAGLYDSVRFEGADDELFTYTIITTSARDDLASVHDRMPVVLEPGDDIRRWLDPAREQWTQDLQALLKPFPGELEWYEVTTEVNKVGNNSPDFVVPLKDLPKKAGGIDSFFGSSKKGEKRKVQDEAEAEKEAHPGKTRKTEEPSHAE